MRKLLLAVLVIATLGMVGIALADTGGGATDACYHNKTGIVRVDTDGTGCKANETPMTLGAGLVTRHVWADGVAPAGDYGQAIARCAAGEVVLGGGYVTETIHPDVHPFTNSLIVIDGVEGWEATVINMSPVDIDFHVSAVCAPGTPSV
ncbi:MAG: hypothetical protein MUF83_04915 [Acidimicrobiales bacterium]|jgi:hypothetical protein|nr:hypothetical protein [Acidimicrobiales bacterium]